MPLSFLDTQPGALADEPAIVLRAAREYQAAAQAIFDDAELLLSALLPGARIEHVGASAIPGAYSRGGVALCLLVAREDFAETLATLGDAGYVLRRETLRVDDSCVLDTPPAEPPASVHLAAIGSARESLVAFRDALRDDALLLARYNGLRLEAAPHGEQVYEDAKDRFVRGVTGG